jgi:hypothetical protein
MITVEITEINTYEVDVDKLRADFSEELAEDQVDITNDEDVVRAVVEQGGVTSQHFECIGEDSDVEFLRT